MDHLDHEHDSEDEGMEDYKIGGLISINNLL